MKTALLFIALTMTASNLLANDWKFEWTDTLNFTESSSGLDGLEAAGENGGVSVSGISGSEIRITAIRVIRGDDEKKGLAFKEVFVPKMVAKDKSLSIKCEFPEKDFDQDDFGSSEISFIIEMPAELAVVANTLNGGVEINGMLGAVSATSVNGGVDITSLKGSPSDLSASTVNGGISVSIASLTGDGDFKTVNGGVDVRITEKLSGDISMETVNGSAELTIPDDASFKLSAETGFSGIIMTDWGGTSTNGNSDGSNFNLNINGGENDISISTLNGTISIGNSKSRAH